MDCMDPAYSVHTTSCSHSLLLLCPACLCAAPVCASLCAVCCACVPVCCTPVCCALPVCVPLCAAPVCCTPVCCTRCAAPLCAAPPPPHSVDQVTHPPGMLLCPKMCQPTQCTPRPARSPHCCAAVLACVPRLSPPPPYPVDQVTHPSGMLPCQKKHAGCTAVSLEQQGRTELSAVWVPAAAAAAVQGLLLLCGAWCGPAAAVV